MLCPSYLLEESAARDGLWLWGMGDSRWWSWVTRSYRLDHGKVSTGCRRLSRWGEYVMKIDTSRRLDLRSRDGWWFESGQKKQLKLKSCRFWMSWSCRSDCRPSLNRIPFFQLHLCHVSSSEYYCCWAMKWFTTTMQCYLQKQQCRIPVGLSNDEQVAWWQQKNANQSNSKIPGDRRYAAMIVCQSNPKW